jgi:phosphoglycerol geranylgeranyltransferase
MSLLNSSDSYFIAGAQVLGAPLVKKFGLEAISLGYIIVGEGGATTVIGRACPIPYDKPELAAAFALTAQYFGMHFTYLESGSGAKQTVSTEMIRLVKDVVQIPLIVGGGIKTARQAKEIANAGADVVITGTLTEKEGNLKEKLSAIVASVKAK